MVRIVALEHVNLEVLDPGRVNLEPLQLEGVLFVDMVCRVNLLNQHLPDSTQVIAISWRHGVIVDKVSTSVDDKLSSIALDALDVMRRMSMNNVNAALVDQETSQLAYFGAGLPRVVRTPMDAKDGQ